MATYTNPEKQELLNDCLRGVNSLTPLALGDIANLKKKELSHCVPTQDTLHTLGDMFHRTWDEEYARATEEEQTLMTTRSYTIAGNDLTKTMRTRQWTMQAIHIRAIAAGTSRADKVTSVLEWGARLSAVLHYDTERARNRATILRSISYTFKFEMHYEKLFLGDEPLLAVSRARMGGLHSSALFADLVWCVRLDAPSRWNCENAECSFKFMHKVYSSCSGCGNFPFACIQMVRRTQVHRIKLEAQQAGSAASWAGEDVHRDSGRGCKPSCLW